MRIRKTTLNDLEPVMAMYDYARKFMQEHGNPNQWINGYPSEEYIRREIADGHSYICENEQGETVGTFCFIVGEDPTYAVIDNGKWLNDAPYRCDSPHGLQRGKRKELQTNASDGALSSITTYA